MLKARFIGLAIVCGAFLLCLEDTDSQQPPPPEQVPAPQVPNGVDVQSRGPVHEAFAAPTSEAQPSPIINKKPPVPLEEMPPEERPEGNMTWISGYYHYDDDRQDFLWISGCWRAKPQGREWVPGYWREADGNGGWQWIGGFWAVADQNNKVSEINYQPAPPPPPAVAPPGPPPVANSFYIPGNYVWVDSRYAWRAGYWTAGQPGYVWVPAYYRWTPRGYVYIPGHWDLILARRGLLYAPVVVNVGLAGPGFVYTPGYAVNSSFIVDAMFIRPAFCHFYFGDYYGPRYVGWGYESCLLYSRRGFYDPYVAYMGWSSPGWFNIQIGLYDGRIGGRIALPPRRLAEIDFRRNPGFIGPGRAIIGIHGGRAVAVARAERIAIRDHAVAARNAAHTERRAAEVRGAAHGTARVNIPSHQNHGPAVHSAPHPTQPAPHKNDPHKK